ncbi:cytochrome C oxidase subunit IV family protein [Sporosarcina ureilytica]|uniref:Cytochrome B6 n=1 Tax=Sporosarcina ureilytica TaxID=298596 RepID=A0A1D8JI65_9BACL|nr:cytochrome C oxidase subunit IV family protein [Sporosarcina ureilytica]AOV08376.1 cytochrome B6 [Sporosarcina ureilytica]
MADIEIYEKTPSEVEISRIRARKGMRAQVIMFSMMIFLTLTSFSIVLASNADVIGFSKFYVIPVILLFAAVQVGLQLYYFMHMNEKGHGIPEMFMFTGALLAFLIVLTFVTIVWWNPLYV